MSEDSVFELMKDWGYYLLEKSHPGSLGHGRLLVAIRDQPTGTHFDPQRLHLCMKDEHGLTRETTLSWLSPLEGGGHVCPGLVWLKDRGERRVDFFTFGGSLEMSMRSGEMVYTMSSPAPILELAPQRETVEDQLAAEAGELLAEMEAQWGVDEQGYRRRLASVDPMQLYVAILHSLLNGYERASELAKAYHALYDALRGERGWLESEHLWMARPPTIEDLLAPP